MGVSGGVKLFADYHTHTKYSDGQGTPAQNIDAASKRGLKEVALTDHGPGSIGIGVAKPETFITIKEEAVALASLFPDIKVLVGAEAAVISRDGSIDLPSSIIKQLDLLIVGHHPYYIPENLKEALFYTLPNLGLRFSRNLQEKMRNANTKAIIETIHIYPVDIISHPDLMLPVDINELTRACTKMETALEINTGHNYNKEEIVHAAARWGAKLVINSDAHSPKNVGEFTSGLALVKRLRFPVEMIINAL